MRFGRAVATGVMALMTLGAADPTPRDVALPWIVVPVPVGSSIVEAKPGDIVVRQPVRPLGYAILSADAVDAGTGNLVAAAATPMLRLRAGSGVVYCVAADPKRTALARARPGSPFLRSCLRDADGDGRFEESAGYDGEPFPLPSVSGRLPKHMHPLAAPIAYAEAPVSAYERPLFVGIRLEGKPLLGTAPVFKDVFGRDGEVDGINRAWPRTDGGTGAIARTGVVLLDGARITVLENNGATIKLRVDQAIPAGEFLVAQRRGTYFF